MLKYCSILLIILISFGCTNNNTPTENNKIEVLCTTGIIASSLSECLPKTFNITYLMGPGVDPHLYKPTPADMQSLQKADVVIYNGLHLEGKMVTILEKLKNSKKVITWADGIEPQQLLQVGENVFDPHIWFNPLIWMDGLNYTTSMLSNLFPNHKTEITNKTAAYNKLIKAAHKEITESFNQVPQEKRRFVTAHDAFQYLSVQYGIELKALQGISTQSEFGLKDVLNLADYMVEHQVKSVFFESSVAKKSVESLIEACKGRGLEVSLGGPLYSDALSEPEKPAGNYLGMLTYNAELITKAMMQ